MKIDFADVVLIFRKYYDEAKKIEYVKKPLAYALYQTWIMVDGKEQTKE